MCTAALETAARRVEAAHDPRKTFGSGGADVSRPDKLGRSLAGVAQSVRAAES